MRKQLLLAGLIVLGASAVAVAADDKPLYVGLKAGVLNPEEDGLDNATQANLLLGIRALGTPLGVEAELGTSLDEGDFSNGNGRWDADTIGVFVTARTPGDIYLKGKGGYYRREISSEFTSGSLVQVTTRATDTEESEAWGAGLGLDLGAANLEAEYTRIDKDFDFYSVGFNAKF